MSLIKILFFIYYGILVLLIQISAHISRESTIKKKKKTTSHCINNPTIHVAFPLVHIKKKKKTLEATLHHLQKANFNLSLLLILHQHVTIIDSHNSSTTVSMHQQ